MSLNPSFLGPLNRSIRTQFGRAIRSCWMNPSLLWASFRLAVQQKRAIGVREAHARQGVHVPPFMIMSVTNSCNLQCKGCYAHAQKRINGRELDSQEIRRILREAEELGVSIVILAGGEPLLRKGLLEITGSFSAITFPVFTNGVQVDAQTVRVFRKQRHVIPVVSLEGADTETDDRRGAGVHERVLDSLRLMRKENIFFGVSATVTSKNADTVLTDGFVRRYSSLGARLFFFLEYVPVEQGTADLVPSREQREEMVGTVEDFRTRFPALFVVFPGDEEFFGGCLSSGRGFVHVSANGDLEPCPLAAYSDTNLRNVSLRDALQSRFLARIREQEFSLSESNGGCALWEKRDWVEETLRETTGL